jgi:polar amino acid transport system substrate-binding protein
MRKFTSLAVIAVAALLTTAGCSSGSDNNAGGSGSATVKKDDAIAAELPDKIKSAGKIVFGSDTSYAPAEFVGEDGKTPAGYDVDLANAIGALLGVTVDIQNADFSSIIPGLGTKYDAGISSFTITAEREQAADFIQYFNAGEAFAVAKGNPKKLDATDLCGTVLGVQTGTVEDDATGPMNEKCAADGKKAIEILRYTAQSDVTTNLVGGKADVMYADSPIIAYAISQTGGQLEQLGEVINSAPQGITTAKGDPLAGVLQTAVQQLIDDGTYLKVLQAWGADTGAVTTAELNPAVQ